MAVELRWLVAFHLTRFVGIYFLILGNRGNLPQGFAKPAGIGDIVIALGAVALLFALGRDGALRRPDVDRALCARICLAPRALAHVSLGQRPRRKFPPSQRCKREST
jgi:hypothetical protein